MIAQLGAGQFALVFLAGLRGVPKELYESAEIDGAGAWAEVPEHHAPDDDADHPV